MNYAAWVNAIAGILEIQVVDATSATPTGTEFDTMIPSAIDYTENRLQRDLDFIATSATRTGTMTANQRSQALPTAPSAGMAGAFIVASQIRLIIGGVRQQPLEPVTRPFLDYAWPSEASITDSSGNAVAPVQWCPNDQANVLIGPAPSTAYSFEIVGTQRFVQMSSTNTSNFLSLMVPDLYIALSAVYYFGYQRDFGAQADDSGTAQSWETQYGKLLQSAQVEEARKNYMDMSPSPSNPTGLTAQPGG